MSSIPASFDTYIQKELCHAGEDESGSGDATTGEDDEKACSSDGGIKQHSGPRDLPRPSLSGSIKLIARAYSKSTSGNGRVDSSQSTPRAAVSCRQRSSSDLSTRLVTKPPFIAV